MDSESLEILQPATTKMLAISQKIPDELCLLICQSVISEAILDAIFTNKLHLSKDNNFELKIHTAVDTDDLDDTMRPPKLGPKQPSLFTQIISAAKSTQTVMDVKVKRDEKQISNISNILNSILKLKNIKKPMMKLPASSEVAKKMKYETKLKLCEQYERFTIDCIVCRRTSSAETTAHWTTT